MREKKGFGWLWALAFAIPGGCFFAMVFFVVLASFEPNGGDLFAAFAYGGFLGVAALGAFVGIFMGLLLGFIAPKKWRAWGTILAGLLAAVISGLAVAWFIIDL